MLSSALWTGTGPRRCRVAGGWCSSAARAAPGRPRSEWSWRDGSVPGAGSWSAPVTPGRPPVPLGPLIDVADDLGVQAELDDPDVRRASLFPRVRAALGRSPTLLLLEDLHWADESTLDLVRYLGRRIDGLPALVVATFRDDEVPASHPLAVVMGDLATAAGVSRHAAAAAHRRGSRRAGPAVRPRGGRRRAAPQHRRQPVLRHRGARHRDGGAAGHRSGRGGGARRPPVAGRAAGAGRRRDRRAAGRDRHRARRLGGADRRARRMRRRRRTARSGHLGGLPARPGPAGHPRQPAAGHPRRPAPAGAGRPGGRWQCGPPSAGAARGGLRRRRGRGDARAQGRRARRPAGFAPRGGGAPAHRGAARRRGAGHRPRRPVGAAVLRVLPHRPSGRGVGHPAGGRRAARGGRGHPSGGRRPALAVPAVLDARPHRRRRAVRHGRGRHPRNPRPRRRPRDGLQQRVPAPGDRWHRGAGARVG